MADIDKELRDIKNAVYGKEVRGSIHDGIQKINEESEESKQKADDAIEITQDLLDETFDSAALEANFEQRLDDEIANLQPEWTQFKDDTVAQLAETVEQIGFASQYGFVADYEGNPQYDGNDENRITATDNTQAFETMLDDAIAKKNLTVYFPRGHYGIKTGNIEKDLTGCTLTIIGDDMENTIIDFIKEDDTKTSYVFPHQANKISELQNPEQIIIKDIHLKATTNYNNVNGNQKQNEAAYFGSVWGVIFKDPQYVKLERVKVSRFNYRGITTSVSDENNLIPRIDIIDCVGIENKGSGFWIDYTDLLYVKNGEYTRNGQIGIRGTGYGITANKKVKKVVINGAYFHHNFKKGFDTHGCVNVEMNDVIFDSNAQRHFDVQDGIASGDNKISLNNIKMTQNDRFFLEQCYQAIYDNDYLNGTRHINFIVANDNDTVSRIDINNLVIENSYNGADKLPNVSTASFIIECENAVVSLNNSSLNFRGWLPNSDLSYSAFPIRLNVKQVYFNNTRIVWPEDSRYRSEEEYGCLFDFVDGMAYRKYSFKNTVLELKNSYVFGRSASGGTSVISPGGNEQTVREYINLTVLIEFIPVENITDNRLLGNVAVGKLSISNVIFEELNRKYKVPENLGTFSEILKPLSFSSPKPAGTEFFEVIVMGRINNNYSLEVIHRGHKARVFNDGEREVNDEFKFKSRTIITENGKTKTRFVFETKKTAGATEDFISAKIVANPYTWGIESINAL